MSGQVDENDPGDEADMPPASRSVEDVWKRLKKLRKVSKHVSKHSERKDQRDSPGRPRDSPEGPGGETAVPGGVHDVQERPRNVRNECANETDAPGRVTGPGGRLELQRESEIIEGEPDHVNVVDSAGCDGKCPRSVRSAPIIETNAPCRDTGPGGWIGERGGPGDLERDFERQSDGNGVNTDGRQCRMDGTTSGPRHDSTQVETDPLAEDETGQRRWYKRDKTDVPRPSAAPTNDHRLPVDHPNPPRRRGQLKSRPRRVSHPRWTYQATRTRQG